MGCAVDAPPIDVFMDPIPCIRCPACEKTDTVKRNTINLIILFMFLCLVLIIKVCNNYYAAKIERIYYVMNDNYQVIRKNNSTGKPRLINNRQ